MPTLRTQRRRGLLIPEVIEESHRDVLGSHAERALRGHDYPLNRRPTEIRGTLDEDVSGFFIVHVSLVGGSDEIHA